MKRVLTIAGSDSGGGAGIQADLKTFAALGVYGLCAITAVTAQNTVGVQGVFELPADFVGLQIDSVVTDIGVDAVKTGMLSNAEIIAVVAAKVREHELPNLVVDPVMVAQDGTHLLREDARRVLARQLIPLAEVITPNLHEAEALTGLKVRNPKQMKEAARAIHALGARHVVVKGGHLVGPDECIDVLFDGRCFTEFTAPRVETKNDHGTGCTFASAIAAELAKGKSVPEAVSTAKEFVTLALQHSLSLGRGSGPLNHFVTLHEGGFGRTPYTLRAAV